MAIRINVDNFNEKVLENNLLVLVDFYTDSCVACKKIAPELSEIEDSYEGKINVFKVNTNFDIELARKYKVLSNPTLILFKNGQDIGKQIGYKKYNEISDWIEENI
ncbi:thioredoxin 1 [Acetitomaculum ruminis DSM 5522]|uniref:Thioredoxin n=1 Tax=Acetitomaculum ruminis DSM 5522 TaxID=1120918 RepID=A0A1I1ABC4_9FIRM|nr:thioredoxin domain-containing protein [Acetitomaculum ruminis]SFB35291.1 thioredoxin 1 [Acetitomaculum ruminis DSM 5522]